MNKTFMKLNKLLILLIFIFNIFTSFSCADETQNIQNNNINIYSKAAILLDCKTGQVIYEYNPDEVLYPASTTKLMTAILTLENCNLTDTVTITRQCS